MSPTRPRVEGERESEILDAALDLLCRVGYDRMTMDAVATEARASKATLYRRWSTKSSLVVDAILRTKEALQVPEVDTGNLRDDLVQMACGHGGLSDSRSADIMAAMVTALHHDPAFAEEFRARGEITADLDLDLLSPALAGIILHRGFVLGQPVDEKTVARVVDEIIMPAATRTTSTTA